MTQHIITKCKLNSCSMCTTTISERPMEIMTADMSLRSTTWLVTTCSKSRPADILLPNWFMGKTAALNVLIISPLNPLSLLEAVELATSAAQIHRQGNTRPMTANVLNLSRCGGWVSPWWLNHMEASAIISPILETCHLSMQAKFCGAQWH